MGGEVRVDTRSGEYVERVSWDRGVIGNLTCIG